ncbi:hypothetical protein WN944_000787 [Citrus x changshan-huyou]|uniref:HTH cro/C1-type domain-containing protein n=1 Tax=Citrus x changshan-huyou TaxID=2935761 RepID=A0AAP0MF79_9ROSI
MGQVVSEPGVLHKSKSKAQELRNPEAVNQALRSGAPVQTVKKFDAGSNKKTAGAVVNMRKLDEGTEPDTSRQIQRARLGKKMSQADLALNISQRSQLVSEYENGKAVPNKTVLAKMEKALGVKL